MRPSRNDPAMQARLMEMAKGAATGSAGGSQPGWVNASPNMSVARSQATGTIPGVARGAQKRRADEQLTRDMGKRRAEEEPRRDTGKRSVGSSATEALRRVSVDPAGGPLEPWMEGEGALGAFQEAVRRVLKVDVVEGLFPKEMVYSMMTMSAVEDQLKVKNRRLYSPAARSY